MQNIHPLRRARDFGQTISDTVQFLKAHWKNLILLYLIFVVPFLLIGTLLGASSFSAFFSHIGSGISNINNPLSLFSPQFIIAIALLSFSFIAYLTVVNLYMKLFEENGGMAPTISDVGSRFAGKFFSNTGYLLMVFILMMLSAIMAIIPIVGILVFMFGGCYVMVCLSLLFPINTIEENPFMISFSRMFYLIKNRWWYTFGIVIILFLIYYFFAAVIGLITNLIFGFSSINFLDQKGSFSLMTEKYFLVMGLSSIIQQVFYLIIHVGIGMHYFSLKEEKDGSGLEERLEQLGSGGNVHGQIEEQY
jgi:hypothetical protein